MNERLEGLHQHAKRRVPEALSETQRVEPSPQDDSIARQFGARDNMVGRPHRAGSGAEKVVLLATDPSEVIAIHKKEFRRGSRETTPIDLTDFEARAAFVRKACLSKILNILLPGSVPRNKHVVSGYGVTVNEKIDGRNVASMNDITKRVLFRLSVRQLGLDIDSNSFNFIKRDSDGSLAYIDSLIEKKSPRKIAQLLKSAVEKARISEQERAQARAHIARYERLIVGNASK